MRYQLKNCRDGSPATYPTTVDITEKDNILTFHFEAEHTSFYCPHDNYNDIHSEGDACEVLIGSDPDRRVYYEMEISAKGALMLAKMTYCGVDETGNPILKLDPVQDCFLQSTIRQTPTGYAATITFNKSHVMTGEGDLFFNAYRLETDGGEMDKHLFALNPTMRPKFHAPSYFLPLKDYT